MADTDPRTQPYKAYRFLVECGGVVGAFTNFSGVKASVQLVKARMCDDERGVLDNFPGITEFENVTLTKGVIGDNDFLNWLFGSTIPSLTSGPQGRGKYRDLDIVALDDMGQRGVVWTLKDAIPVGYELKPMDAGQSAVLAESIEFAITGVSREVEGPNGETTILDKSAKKPQGAPNAAAFSGGSPPAGRGGTSGTR